MLSRRLAETLNGTLLLASSSEGTGSTFIFQMKPIEVAGAKLIDFASLHADLHLRVPSVEAILSLAGMKILLVEDSPDNQVLINKYVSMAGATITTVSNGLEGVEHAMNGEFDVLLMDIQMPVLDGHEAAKQLRLSNYLKPIIALTAHAMKAEHEKCLASGFTDFLTKPIEKNRLIRALSAYHTTQLNS